MDRTSLIRRCRLLLAVATQTAIVAAAGSALAGLTVEALSIVTGYRVRPLERFEAYVDALFLAPIAPVVVTGMVYLVLTPLAVALALLKEGRTATKLPARRILTVATVRTALAFQLFYVWSRIVYPLTQPVNYQIYRAVDDHLVILSFWSMFAVLVSVPACRIARRIAGS